jgi:hypothetical protein
MSYPTVGGRAVEGALYREAQSCLGPAFTASTYKFFLTGTTTPANVYQDGALSSAYPITGQVQSDNFGRFPPIYLDSSVIYKVQFYDKTNTLRWTQDPYAPPVTTLGASSLSSVGFKIATTGEVTIPAPNAGGSGSALTLKAGTLGITPLQISATLPGNSALIVNSSATTGAQTATFAASNKPGTATSSPAGWLPITCDGVQYYTPIWHGNNFTPYISSPTAIGESINSSTVTFGGNGITTGTGLNVFITPGNWFAPVAANIGAGYYINITKTGGLSGLAFSAAQGAWTNITAGGLTISSNAQAPINGTYQLSSSVTGSPVVASGTITLSGNNGVQQPTYNGANAFLFTGSGTATFSGAGASNWYLPTTANIGSGFYVSLTQTGGAGSFTGISGVTNISNSGLTIGVTGPGGTLYTASGTYVISSDSSGLVVLGTGSFTISGGSLVQSPNWNGATPLDLNGDGSADFGGAGTSDWYFPTAANVGSGYWINITRTGGTTGVNFTAAQGSWTNITNGGLTIDISGYTGDVGTVSASGTWQISNNSSGTPVLGSGTIQLNITGLTIQHDYSVGSFGASAVETVPTGASNVLIEVWGISGPGGGGGDDGVHNGIGGGGGAAGGYCRSSYACAGGQTINYIIGDAWGVTTADVSGPPPNSGNSFRKSIVSSGTLTVTTMTALSGGGGAAGPDPGPGTGVGGTGGTASGGNVANTTGTSGSSTTTGTGAAGAAATATVVPFTFNPAVGGTAGGNGRVGGTPATGGNAPSDGWIRFYYT